MKMLPLTRIFPAIAFLLIIAGCVENCQQEEDKQGQEPVEEQKLQAEEQALLESLEKQHKPDQWIEIKADLDKYKQETDLKVLDQSIKLCKEDLVYLKNLQEENYNTFSDILRIRILKKYLQKLNVSNPNNMLEEDNIAKLKRALVDTLKLFENFKKQAALKQQG